MWNERMLEADIEYAAEMVREGLATAQQAAQACGIPLASLQAHLAGSERSTPESDAKTPHTLKGSVSSSNREQGDETALESANAQPNAATETGTPDAIVETTDYFVFHREGDRWVWKRVDQDGNVVKACEDGFKFYLDCVADARPHGFNGRPLFIFAASDIASLNAPDRTR